MKNNKITLSRYLTLIAALEFALPAVLLSFLVIYFIILPNQESEFHTIHNDLSYIEQLLNLQIDEYKEDFMSVVYLDSNVYESEKLLEYISTSRDIEDMTEFYVMNNESTVLYNYPSNSSVGLNLKKLYSTDKKNKEGDLVISSSSDGLITIKMFTDERLYVANFRIKMDQIMNKDTMNFGNITFFLVDNQNNILSTNETVWVYTNPTILEEKQHDFGDDSETHHRIDDVSYKGEKFVMAHSVISDLDWKIVMLISYKTIGRSTYQYFEMLAIALGFMFVILAAFQLRIRNSIVKPIYALSEAFGSQNIELMEQKTIEMSGIEEIDDLTKGFTMLIKHLSVKKKEMDEFIYIASHDLQEPLRVMSSYINIIEMEYDTLLDDDGRKYLHYVVDASMRMRNLILGLLEYSRASNSKIFTEQVNLDEVFQIASENLSLAILESGAVIDCGHLPTVRGEKNALVQLFQNLIGNSIKFSKDVPSIEISFDGTRLRFSDKGIGIESEYLNSIFKPFKRLNKTSEYPGTGIGLSVVAKVVENHGWKLDVESEVGKGTVFEIELEEKMVKEHVKILIVEDNPADIDLMKYTFKKSKLENELIIVEDGKSALDFILKQGEYANALTPDLIILDINIPKINGLEVLRIIKQDEEARMIPVVIMTTSSSEEDVLKAYKNYVNAYLVKPVDIHNFIDVILKLEDFMIQVVKKPHH